MTEDRGSAKARQPGGRLPRVVIVLIVIALMGMSFGAGALVELRRFRGAENTWKEDRAGLESKLAAQATELSLAKSRDLLWRLDDGMATVYGHLADRNFGLAQEQLTAVSTMLANGSADLEAEVATKLAPLEPLLADIGHSAESLSPDAKQKASQARSLLQGILGESPP